MNVMNSTSFVSLSAKRKTQATISSFSITHDSVIMSDWVKTEADCETQGDCRIHEFATKNVPSRMAFAVKLAKIMGATASIIKKDSLKDPIYPWKDISHRDYPNLVTNPWKRELNIETDNKHEAMND